MLQLVQREVKSTQIYVEHRNVGMNRQMEAKLTSSTVEEEKPNEPLQDRTEFTCLWNKSYFASLSATSNSQLLNSSRTMTD